MEKNEAFTEAWLNTYCGGQDNQQTPQLSVLSRRDQLHACIFSSTANSSHLWFANAFQKIVKEEIRCKNVCVCVCVLSVNLYWKINPFKPPYVCVQCAVHCFENSSSGRTYRTYFQFGGLSNLSNWSNWGNATNALTLWYLKRNQ